MTKKAAKKSTKRAAKKAVKRAPLRKRNSDAAAGAKRLYQRFHQKPATKARKVQTAVAVPVELAELGRVTELHVKAPAGHFVLRPTGVTLTATPDGRQMYFVGGDQTPPLRQMGVDGSKVHVNLGPLRKLVYLTQKGFHNFADVEYVHRMGEDGGTPPDLNFDTASGLLYLVGGTYKVKPEGITN